MKRITLPVIQSSYASLRVLIAITIMFIPLVHSKAQLGGSDPSDPFQNMLPLVITSGEALAQTWPMAGANPERTSWNAVEVRGKLKPIWYKPFEAFIPYKVQVIAANGLLYISTANGLYALDADTGAERWVYPTQLPLGNSPTVIKGTVYVGGFDHKIHALNAATGQLLWTFEAGAGFDTNPLVINNILYAGNRDGYFYAIYIAGANTGKLAWKFQTQGPIHFSAAFHNGVLYFASDDSYAYALNAQTGAQVWKSAKLPGAGFHSWWPVIYKDWVIFAGSNNYRSTPKPGIDYLHEIEKEDIYPNRDTDPPNTFVGPLGNAPGDWAPGTQTLNASKPNTVGTAGTTAITEYFEQKPWRRTYFVLGQKDGKEYTSDFDKDGKPEYAPILWLGTRGEGNRYPPVIGIDGVLYQPNDYISDKYIPDGQISGWTVSSPNISIVSSDKNAIDEPEAYSSGGKLIYWTRCCDRVGGAFDITQPVSAPNRSWYYYNYDLPSLIPGYNAKTFVTVPYTQPFGGVFGGRNGSYGWHGDTSAPIPYRGKVYLIGSNALIAFAPQGGTPQSLPMAKKVAAPDASMTTPSDAELKSRLAEQVRKILDAGHLRPGYFSSGMFDLYARNICGDTMVDLWHFPGDILVTLIAALPYLPADMQQETRTYLQKEFTAYPPYQFDHIGWKDGAAREAFDLPPEVEADRVNFPPLVTMNNVFEGWKVAPQELYALWKYAQEFGNAKNIFDASKGRLNTPPADSVLLEFPYVHNAYIAGYMGYLELQKLAGYPEDSQVRSQLDRLLALRASSISADSTSYNNVMNKVYCRTLDTSRNFIYLTPELGQYLHDHALSKVQQVVQTDVTLAPLWFATKAEVVMGEGVMTPPYDYQANFQAKAWILKEPRSELARFLDVPAMAVGDLYYIQNLVATIEAGNGS